MFKVYKKCAELIGDYGGVTIFAGGDDLLFLAPLANQNDKTLFDLFDEIRKEFVDSLLEKNDETDNDNKKVKKLKMNQLYHLVLQLHIKISNL